ncbi:transposase family protein [Actinomyces qiguomingii]|uniref:transposase family protein n=1 Tax=Actinomyces qiguomingii TaxID=2057800 RepID=UPI000FFF2FA2|nr:transposase family protein [Actinomyces qiguomingii]
MNASTKLDRHQLQDLCAILHNQGDLPVAGSRVLGLYQRIKLTVMALRHNTSQELLAEIFDISQPTASRIISSYTALIADALGRGVPTVEDIDPTQTLIIDGTVLKTWDWKGVPGLFSGKYRTTGLNVQVACTPSGAIAWVGDPLPGATHDAAALRASGLLDVPPHHLPDGATAALHIGDKGYIGLDMITPVKKQPGGPLPEADKAYNTSINRIRHVVERAIANLKTWRVLHTGYRRPIQTFPQTITATLALIFTYTP